MGICSVIALGMRPTCYSMEGKICQHSTYFAFFPPKEVARVLMVDSANPPVELNSGTQIYPARFSFSGHSFSSHCPHGVQSRSHREWCWKSRFLRSTLPLSHCLVSRGVLCCWTWGQREDKVRGRRFPLRTGATGWWSFFVGIDKARRPKQHLRTHFPLLDSNPIPCHNQCKLPLLHCLWCLRSRSIHTHLSFSLNVMNQSRLQATTIC